MTTTDSSRAEAVAWLVGRLRFEQLLADLQRRAVDAEEASTTITGPATVETSSEPVAA